MKTKAYWCSRRFYDSKKFPYGFSRSGLFTPMESELLESRGHLLQALLNEKVFDPNADDLAFVMAIRQKNYTFNEETRVWSKYRLPQKRLISVASGWYRQKDESNIIEMTNVKGEVPMIEWDDQDDDRIEILRAS